jgi:hypothetical protein
MSEKLNIDKIRQEVYRSYTEDGLIDLAIGIVIFGFGSLLMVDIPWLVGVLGVIPLLIWYLGKRYLTIPRIGTFQPSKTMNRKFTGFLVYMIAIGVGVLVSFFLLVRSGENLLNDHPLALFGFVLALGISALGLMMKTNRLYYYSLLVFLAMAIGETMNKSIRGMDMYLISVIIAGGVILVAGSIVLIGFLRKYPVISMEE